MTNTIAAEIAAERGCSGCAHEGKRAHEKVCTSCRLAGYLGHQLRFNPADLGLNRAEGKEGAEG